MNEFYDHRYTKPRGIQMRLPVQAQTTNPEFHQALLNAKSLRAKLACCYVMLSQSGTFSDSGPEVWALKQDVMEHLPEEMRSGRSKKERAGKALR
jgi:hypothetical protein